MKRRIPNCFTLLNLVFGCVALIYALNGWGVAGENQPFVETAYPILMCICAAALVDFFDGLIARLFNAASEMGKQLDSLADLVSFGVVPGIIVFQFLKISFAKNHPEMAGNIWYMLPALIIPCSGAYRLARFNLSKSHNLNFEGMPIPSAGIFIATFPLIFQNVQVDFVQNLLQNYLFWYAIIFVVSYLMTSTLPMLSLKFKNLSFKDNWAKFTLFVLAVILAILLKWLAIPVMFVLYVLFSIVVLEKSR